MKRAAKKQYNKIFSTCTSFVENRHKINISFFNEFLYQTIFLHHSEYGKDKFIGHTAINFIAFDI